MDRLAEIKRLYFNATAATIQRDLARAIALLKEMPSEDEREHAAAYMDGLSQMRSEWSQAARRGSNRDVSRPPPGAGGPKRPGGPRGGRRDPGSERG
jgi:hypothetical protein